jgi:hypothetical protein
MTVTMQSFPPLNIATVTWPKAPHKTLLGPHQIRTASAFLFPGTSMERFEDGAASVAVIGIATYLDEFSNKRVTMFCQHLAVPAVDYLQGEANHPYTTTNTDCDDYNCSDQDCAKYKGVSWLPADVIP